MSSSIEKRCFKLIQQIVTQRSPYCQKCSGTPVSGHHVFGRRNRGSAFDPDSCISLCAECHDGWARQCPAEARELLKALVGEQRYSFIAFMSAQVVRLRTDDYKRIADELKTKLEGMKRV
jgi:hypothetical protein